MSSLLRRTFVDSGVLIAAARGDDEVGRRAMALLDDPTRVFVSSALVRLEVLPKPTYNRFPLECDFFNAFFQEVETVVPVDEALTTLAFKLACDSGLSAIDALHVAAACLGNADELATSEKPTKPMFRVSAIKVNSIHESPGGS